MPSPKRSNLTAIGIAVIAVATLYSQLFAEHFICPGDPKGSGIATGVGGIAGLILALLVQLVWFRQQSRSE